MAPSTSQRHLTSNETDIHYTLTGPSSGPLVIFLHGLGGSTDTFTSLLPSFPETSRLANVDIEGFGQTPLNTTRPLSFPQYVFDLHDLITHLSNHQSEATSTESKNGDASFGITLVGHSLGAIISLHYASQYPDTIKGLLLLGVGRSIPPAFQPRMRGLAIAAREQGMSVVAETAVKTNFPQDRQNDESQVAEVRKAVSQCNAESYAQTAEVVASDDHVDPEYSNIKCPVVFVAGDGDMISTPQRSMDISELVGGPSKVLVVKSGHQMILQDFEGVQEAVRVLYEMMS